MRKGIAIIVSIVLFLALIKSCYFLISELENPSKGTFAYLKYKYENQKEGAKVSYYTNDYFEQKYVIHDATIIKTTQKIISNGNIKYYFTIKAASEGEFILPVSYPLYSSYNKGDVVKLLCKKYYGYDDEVIYDIIYEIIQ